jgi:outer membrane lipoprotein LolB
MPWLQVAGLAILLSVLSATGCTLQSEAVKTQRAEVSSWHGRLAVRVEADQVSTQAQSFAAGFELTGSALAGELTLFTPLGSTAAALSWTPQIAVMRTHGEIRHFESLDALIRNAVGTEVPVAALFAWLAGDNMTASGWSADLSQHANGRITARRLQDPPMAELILVLEK